MGEFIHKDGKWVYTGDITDVTKEVGDNAMLSSCNPADSPDAHHVLATYTVTAAIAEWQRSWRKVRVEKFHEDDLKAAQEEAFE